MREETKGDGRPNREKPEFLAVTQFGTVVHRASWIIQVSRLSGVHGTRSRTSEGIKTVLRHQSPLECLS